MQRTNSQPISALLQEFLRQQGLETPLNQHRLVDAWPEVMGPAIARYTKEVFIKDQTLIVRLTSAPLKQNLMMERANLAQRLNNHVGAYVISDIKFI